MHGRQQGSQRLGVEEIRGNECRLPALAATTRHRNGRIAASRAARNARLGMLDRRGIRPGGERERERDI